MAYSDIAMLAVDWDFINRTTACAATELIPEPTRWASNNAWQMAATPGFGDAYGYAVLTGVVRPGNDPSVITDGDILSAVQALVAGTLPEEAESPEDA